MQVRLEHFPAGCGAQDRLRVIVRASGNAGNAIQVAPKRIVKYVHHSHVVLEGHEIDSFAMYISLSRAT
jgi:hypothetical protein